MIRVLRASACTLFVALTGCITVVSVHGERADDIRIVPVIGSARIEPANGKAVSIDAWSIGAGQSCGAYGIGFVTAHCVTVDPKGCPVAIVKSTGPVDEELWGRIATETRVDCPQGTPRMVRGPNPEEK